VEYLARAQKTAMVRSRCSYDWLQTCASLYRGIPATWRCVATGVMSWCSQRAWKGS